MNLVRFINTLDYSLDLLRIIETYEKVYRNTRFSFEANGHTYTTRVINVTFEYSLKEFNRVHKDTYVKSGYNYSNLVFEDCVCVIDDILVGIMINNDVEKPLSDDTLGKVFQYDDGQYKVRSHNPTQLSTFELRKHLYENGFTCDGIKYVRFKRSSGSSRVGKCLFIDEKLYKRMHKWEMCGLKVKNNQKIDLAALEAYISLTLSSIIDTIEIQPYNILVMDDYESIFKNEVIETFTNEDNELETIEHEATIKNSIWDGQSLLDKSLFGKYEQYGMLLLRNRFFKSACFNTNIQKYFKDKGITDVQQLNGFTLANDISDIKLITTPSSIKYMKFGTLKQWLDNFEPVTGVVKFEKPTHYFSGEMVQLHYQLLNSLQLTENEVKEFLQPSLDLLTKIKTDPSILRYYINYSHQDEEDMSPVTSKNDIIYKLLGINNKFTETKMYDEFKKDLVKSYTKKLRQGKVLSRGTYSTLFGNGYEMLQNAIGEFDGSSDLGKGNIMCSYFDYNKTLLGSRSPHISAGNVLLTKNISNCNLEKYFNLTDNIVCVNSINENLLQRLSGADQLVCLIQ